MNKALLNELIAKYLAGEANAEESAVLETWYANFSESAQGPSPELITKASQRIAVRLGILPARQRRLWVRRVAAAAAVLLVVFIGALTYQRLYTANTVQIKLVNDIEPGRNGATLTLANGKQIRLSNATGGELANEAGVRIIKTAAGELTYLIQGEGSVNSTSNLNTLSTSKGETYSIVLPDGSKVWLNAASSLTYPANFASLKDRTVELTGEAYFEIAKVYAANSIAQNSKARTRIPFFVKTPGQQVEVLGTHFNINAYPDETIIKTTLLEGSVRVTKSKSNDFNIVLKPGQQSLLTEQSLSVAAADLEREMDWRNSKFIFNDETLKSFMTRVARWYNVEVHYRGDVGEVKLVGRVSREKKISTILQFLKQTAGINATLEGQKIILCKEQNKF